MATVDLQTLRSRVYTAASALTSDTGLTSAVVDEFVNTALRQVTEEHDWPWLEQTATITTVAGTQGYALPAAYVRTEGLVAVDTGEPLSLVPRLAIFRDTAVGRPRSYSIDGGSILLGPTPNAVYSIRHLYIASEAVLSNPADVPLIPLEFSRGVVEYAAYLALRFLRQEERAATALDSYKSWLRRVQDNRIRSREPMRIRVRPGGAL